MLQSFLARATLIVLSSALAVLSVACSQDKQTTKIRGNEQPRPVGNLAATPLIEATTYPLSSPEPQPQSSSAVEPNSFELALDKAAGALTISQSAQSADDWKLVANQLQDAIALMKNVQQESPNFTVAQIKISEYQRQIQSALHKAAPKPQPPLQPEPQRVVVMVPQKQIKPEPTLPVAPVAPLLSKEVPVPKPILPTPELVIESNNVFIAPIKRRIGGTPIVEVTFNGEEKFDMIVDTGASGTVITQNMANALGVVPVGKAKANTASSKAVEFTIGYVDSMAVAGVMINKVPVAIAGSDLETGLLGHDFFGNYDVTIKRNVVEFRPQSHSEINSPETELTAPTLPKERHFLGSP
ncbi:MAG: retroviral-like aspartic protease family protein [Mojavia pulchra JT2-VF2]|uniref:Retroviral-like aspartic protease family protein n=1 Tax=Mojavia pulchra JT2-VF2 TaxID=287848 RepID=A0A951Q4E1_9NOST|nr:retroviral-like aspartic protease family protein [Mojavia pulchra JT2-VF2]